ncbi:class I SAM-dependent methyltransferase [Winogradskyella ursingii]|uniref:class I SAM-dependent methyltransferase n=1 Tax=Winogradskyella ursingii TaxID=2686079 RepID=UPI0015C863C4|nr:class I SAM-dependent methyltransferase [Winogradskyella ursingii]
MKKTTKKPWPTKAVMKQIYEQHLWGGNDSDFYSGEGSHDSAIIKPYVEAVRDFLKSNNKKLRVCDLGCGDFNVGKELVPYAQLYFAVDIVEDLIERNRNLFKENNLEFFNLDISKDDIPMADCLILRQVLQHLSNAEIQKIVNKLHNYKYVILTEHLPLGDFIPNKDKITSQGIRLKQGSGVDLLAEPFNLKIESKQLLAETVLKQPESKIVTLLFTMF